MSKESLTGIAAIVLLAVAGFVLVRFVPHTSSTEEEAAARAFVVEFGGKLKDVELLGPDLSTQLKNVYGPYITPNLLATWQADPTLAPGRQTSSPWPERIDIVDVKQTGLSTFAVEGNVIEITSADAADTPAGVYPVSIVVEKTLSGLVISSFVKGAYSQLPQRTTVTGVWECLPHKDPTLGTKECAFGIKQDGTGEHYSVDLSVIETANVSYKTGTRVRVEGILTPVEMLSAEQIYDIKGVVRAASITQIK